jgi:hypothetical protein
MHRTAVCWQPLNLHSGRKLHSVHPPQNTIAARLSGTRVLKNPPVILNCGGAASRLPSGQTRRETVPGERQPRPRRVARGSGYRARDGIDHDRPGVGSGGVRTRSAGMKAAADLFSASVSSLVAEILTDLKSPNRSYQKAIALFGARNFASWQIFPLGRSSPSWGRRRRGGLYC